MSPALFPPDTSSFPTWTRVAANSGFYRVSNLDEEEVRVSDRIAPQDENDDGDRFAVRAGRFIYRSGTFLALKIQSAKSTHQMDEFAKEIVNLEKLRGHSNIVQIRDHSVLSKTRHVVILMELAACDLDTFFKRSGYSFAVSGVFSIWRSLVRAVGVAHTQDIIHRDLKPQNFLLVPIAPPFADRILATTAVPPEKFEFRIVNRVGDGVTTNDPEKVGDVELILRDSATDDVQVLQLVIKVSDFGLAQPLDLDANADASHLSVRGHAGTIKYMAPEAFRASADGVQRLTKHFDIWSLGVMLFQMLHGGRTPFDGYCSPGNNIRAAVAIASKDIHVEVMKFERHRVWATERKSLQRELRAVRSIGSESDTATNLCSPSAMVLSLLSTEFLFRICENCLAFEASDRVLAGDLEIWLEHLIDTEWWGETIRGLSDVAVQALLSGVSMQVDDEAANCQLDNLNLVQQGGHGIEQVFFQELRRATSSPAPNVNANIVLLPAAGEGVEERRQRRDDGEQVQAVAVPVRGDAVEKCEQGDEGEQLQAVAVPVRGDAVEKCEQDGREQLQAVILPARGEAVEKCEQDGREQLQAVILPARGEVVEKCEQGDDGEQLQAVILPARGEAAEEREQGADDGEQVQVVAVPAKGEAERDHGGEHLQAVAFPATRKAEAVEEREQGDEDDELQAVLLPAIMWEQAVEKREEGDCAPQAGALPDSIGIREGREGRQQHPAHPSAQEKAQLLSGCINEEDCGRHGAGCATKECPRTRPKRRGFAPPHPVPGSRGFNIVVLGAIIGVVLVVLAVGLFVMLKLIPETATQGPSMPIPPTSVPTFLAPTISIPSPTTPVLVDPTIAPPAPERESPPAPASSPAASPAGGDVGARGLPSPASACPSPSRSPTSLAPMHDMLPPGPASSTTPAPSSRSPPVANTGTIPAPSSRSPVANADAVVMTSPERQKPSLSLPAFVDDPSPSSASLSATSLPAESSPPAPPAAAEQGEWEQQQALVDFYYSCNTANDCDKEGILAAVKRHGLVLAGVPAKFRADREVVWAAVGNNGNALAHASPDLRADRHVVLAAVKHSDCGSAFEFASSDLRADRDVVLAAVKKNGLALKFASPDLRADRGVVLAAVENDGMALRFANLHLHCYLDSDIVWAAFSQNYVSDPEGAEDRVGLWKDYVPEELKKKVVSDGYPISDLLQKRSSIYSSLTGALITRDFLGPDPALSIVPWRGMTPEECIGRVPDIGRAGLV